jgi:hypothetical protein
LQAASHDAFGKSFDHALGLVERTGDLCAVLLDAGRASVASGAQARSAPRRVQPRRWTSRHAESRRLDESKPSNNPFIAEGMPFEATGIPRRSRDGIHRQIESFYWCAYFGISNDGKTAHGMLTNGKTNARDCFEFSRFLSGDAL